MKTNTQEAYQKFRNEKLGIKSSPPAPAPRNHGHQGHRHSKPARPVMSPEEVGKMLRNKAWEEIEKEKRWVIQAEVNHCWCEVDEVRPVRRGGGRIPMSAKAANHGVGVRGERWERQQRDRTEMDSRKKLLHDAYDLGMGIDEPETIPLAKLNEMVSHRRHVIVLHMEAKRLRVRIDPEWSIRQLERAVRKAQDAERAVIYQSLNQTRLWADQEYSKARSLYKEYKEARESGLELPELTEAQKRSGLYPFEVRYAIKVWRVMRHAVDAGSIFFLTMEARMELEKDPLHPCGSGVLVDPFINSMVWESISALDRWSTKLIASVSNIGIGEVLEKVEEDYSRIEDEVDRKHAEAYRASLAKRSGKGRRAYRSKALEVVSRPNGKTAYVARPVAQARPVEDRVEPTVAVSLLGAGVARREWND